MATASIARPDPTAEICMIFAATRATLKALLNATAHRSDEWDEETVVGLLIGLDLLNNEIGRQAGAI